jgi:mono/diheme cytochrome c family protein
MKSLSVLSLAAACAAALPTLAADAGRKPTADPYERPATPHYQPTRMPVSASRGEQIFNDHCAICHGLHGKGDGPRSAFFQPGVQFIPDLTVADYLKGRDEQILESIRQGLSRLPEPAYVMPQFKYILSEEEIRSVLAYVKTLPAKAKKL